MPLSLKEAILKCEELLSVHGERGRSAICNMSDIDLYDLHFAFGMEVRNELHLHDPEVSKALADAIEAIPEEMYKNGALATLRMAEASSAGAGGVVEAAEYGLSHADNCSYVLSGMLRDYLNGDLNLAILE